MGPLVALAVATLLAGTGCGLARPPASIGPTQDPALAATLSPACAGQAVPGAGQVAAGANHLVAVDLSGRELYWQHFDDETGAPADWPWELPAAWLPTDLADAEIVACIQADQVTVQLEVCRYAGGLHTIARYESARQVVAVEAATGHVLAVLALTDRANECDVLEKTSTSALYGDVLPEQVWAALDGLVSAGRFQSVCQAMCADAPIDTQSVCQASCAGDSIRDQLGPWGFEAAGEALRLDLDVLRTELAGLNTGISPDASLRTIAEDRGMAYAGVRDATLAGARARLDARVAAGMLSAATEAFTLDRLERWLDDGGRPDPQVP